MRLENLIRRKNLYRLIRAFWLKIWSCRQSMSIKQFVGLIGILFLLSTIVVLVAASRPQSTGDDPVTAKISGLPHEKPERNKNLPTNLDIHLLDSSIWQYEMIPGTTIPIRQAPHPSKGRVWPHPMREQSGTTFFRVADLENFTIKIGGRSNFILDAALDRFKAHLSSLTNLPEPVSQSSSRGGEVANVPTSRPKVYHQSVSRGQQQLTKLTVEILAPSSGTGNEPASRALWPSLEMDESYNLSVSTQGALLRAKQVWGALRGLESLVQLLWQADDKSKVYINKTNIEDAPRFKHRGILVDTSRHFINKETLMKNIEAMAMNKMNVMHWHMIDDNSFPYESKLYPNLTQKGAYHPLMVYTAQDIKEIVEFARLRGIRVIPEFDVPGHTYSLSQAMPHIMSQCQFPSVSSDKLFFGPINPLIESTYTFLTGLFKELTSLFPDSYMHLGGDEVETVCWDNDEFMATTRKALNFLKDSDLHEYLWTRLQNILTNIGREMVVWQEAVDSLIEVRKSTIVQVWKSSPKPYLAKGLKVIYSTCWYIDHHDKPELWSSYYTCDPGRELPDKNPDLLLGGEAAMWTEYQRDTSILTRIWPVTSLIAERLWSPEGINDLQLVGPRLEEQRCRMQSQGIDTRPIFGPSFCDSEPLQFIASSTDTAGKIEHNLTEINDGHDDSALYHTFTVTSNKWIVFVFGILTGWFILFVLNYLPKHRFHQLINVPDQRLPRLCCAAALLIFVLCLLGVNLYFLLL